MKNDERILLYYSRGPHFMRTLKRLREKYPHSVLTAMVPPGFPEEVLASKADAVLVTAKPRGVAEAWKQIGGIRRARFDRVVVLFDSTGLRLFAALSGARERWCYSVEGRCFPLRRHVTAILMGALWRNLRGHLRYAKIHYIVRYRPVLRRKALARNKVSK